MTLIINDPAAEGLSIYGPAVRGRACGSCKLCCVLIPVDLDDGWKPHNTACKHLRSKGCGIYPKRPTPCQVWSCRWLMDDTTKDLRRPDLTGYIIDPMTDVILADGGPMDVLQVWVDPARPDSHRDPALRAWLVTMHATHGMVAIARRGPGDGVVLVPPAASGTGEWLEVPGTMNNDEDMKARLEAVGATRFQL